MEGVRQRKGDRPSLPTTVRHPLDPFPLLDPAIPIKRLKHPPIITLSCSIRSLRPCAVPNAGLLDLGQLRLRRHLADTAEGKGQSLSHIKCL